MKKHIDNIDAKPSKRLFLSIISDYDLNTSICELVDNVLDIWVTNGRSGSVSININLDLDQQTINVTDNSGGLHKDNLGFIVGPGQTGNLPTAETIGIFGVGTKRAVVALSQDIRISTRYRDGATYMVGIDDNWLKEDDWQLPVYEVDPIPSNSTHIELLKLRVKLDKDMKSGLRNHLGATYARFLDNKNLAITVNSEPVKPITFESWAYPPNYTPHEYTGKLTAEDGTTIKVKYIAGLSTVSSPAIGEYGVYLYCNDRLISRANKSYDVGFTKGKVGFPHASISLTRAIVSLNGSAQWMPWNSSKSDINPNNIIFLALRDHLVEVVKDYASISRRFVGDWQNNVFQYTSGQIVKVKVDDFPTAKRSYLPPLPIAKPRYGDRIKAKNKSIIKKKPWTTGLSESIVAVDLILKQKLDQKNRIALILLDSTLEIAFKEFLVNETGRAYSNKRLGQLFSDRSEVQKEIQEVGPSLHTTVWKKINYYYNLRCKLVHEKATVTISDSDIDDCRDVVQKVLRKLFKLKLEE